MREATCYYCGVDASTSEHVPPRCLFPERKDSLGIDYRKNLITVPSCDAHNTEKSKDDEFLMACVTPIVGNNGVGYIQTQTKLRRAFARNDGQLLKLVMPDRKQAMIELPNGSTFPVLIGNANMPRLCRVLEHVARGLYFHIKGERFVGDCHILPSFISFPEDSDLEAIKQISGLMVRQERGDWAIHGENPEIFQFAIGPVDQFGLLPMVMTFFRRADVYVSFQPDGVKRPFRNLSEATPENPIRIEIHQNPPGPEADEPSKK